MKRLLLSLLFIVGISVTLFSQDFGTPIMKFVPEAVVEQTLVGDEWIETSDIVVVSEGTNTLLFSEYIVFTVGDISEVFRIIKTKQVSKSQLLGNMKSEESGEIFIFSFINTQDGLLFLIGTDKIRYVLMKKKEGNGSRI